VGNDFNFRRIIFVETGEDEVEAIIQKHGAFASAHEGLGVLLEEVHELQAEIFLKRDKRDGQRMYAECVQIAAVAATIAITIAEDIGGSEAHHGA
jgi:hypothetical protein